MSAVHLLDKSVFELIAAGEVVERPSSVVKELIENAIDAEATSIEVEIQNGGKRKIQITDNGIGMSFEDCKTAFLRHATSKVATQEDLESISTLGFRGEALASICAVSKVELFSKQKDVPFGTRYLIAGGEELIHEEAGTADGTTIVIEDLFFNVPARLKFLKKDVTEGNAIADIIEKIAISHPEISITFRKDNKMVLQTPGNGKLLDCIYAVYGKAFAKTLMEISYTLGDITVTGYVSKPMDCRTNRSMQHCFINGRYIKSKTCVIGLEEGYKGSIMIGKFPACILFLNLPPNKVDVNVHPAKIEVRFSDEQSILQAVYTAVKQAITKNGTLADNTIEALHLAEAKQTISRNYQAKGNIPPSEQVRFSMRSPVGSQITSKNPSTCSNFHLTYETKQKNQTEKQQNNSSSSNVETVSPMNSRISPDIKDRIVLEEPISPNQTKTVSAQSETETLPLAKEDRASAMSPKEEESVPAKGEESIRIIGELFETYILAESNTTFYLMDKHAAHERMIYENIRSSAGDLSRQLLLSPLVVSLSKTEYEMALSSEDVIIKFGFSLEDFGKNTVLVREIPMLLDSKDCKEVLLEILDNLLKQKQDLSPNTLDHLYHTMACKAAIKANDKNSPQELERLFFEVFSNHNIRYCPHGRPVLLSYSKEKVEKQFGR